MIPPMLVGNILHKLPTEDTSKPLFHTGTEEDECYPGIKAYLEDSAPLLKPHPWARDYWALPANFPTEIGIVRVHIKAPRTPWQAGTISPAQQLVPQPSQNFWTHHIIDCAPRIAGWDPAKTSRAGMAGHPEFYRIQQNSLHPMTYDACPFIWPGQAVATAEPVDTHEDTTDE